LIPGRWPGGELWRPPAPKRRSILPLVLRGSATAAILGALVAYLVHVWIAPGLPVWDRWSHSSIAVLLGGTAIVGAWWRP
jgi:hypothetical protein